MDIHLTPAEVEYLEGLVSQDEEGCIYVGEESDGFDEHQDRVEAQRQLKLASNILSKLRGR